MTHDVNRERHLARWRPFHCNRRNSGEKRMARALQCAAAVLNRSLGYVATVAVLGGGGSTSEYVPTPYGRPRVVMRGTALALVTSVPPPGWEPPVTPRPPPGAIARSSGGGGN